MFDPELEVGCRLPIRQSNEPRIVRSGVRSCSIPVRFLFEVGPEVDVQMCCQSVVVVQVLCRYSGVVVVRCSVFFPGPVRLPQNFQDFVPHEVHGTRPR